MEERRNFGFVPTKMDGSEYIFGASMPSNSLPKTYSYRRFLPNVLDQGFESICVPCSVSAYLNWKENLETGSKKDNKVNYYEIYDIRTNNGEGMTFKEAFSYLRHHGVSSKAGNLKIGHYALVNGSYELLKLALVMNGPCLGALPVFNSNPEFWKQNKGDGFLGGHAISIVGYDEEGFIIRNSWGTGFANNGYTTLKYEDYDRLMEVWTIVD